jgi:hypothetical protein
LSGIQTTCLTTTGSATDDDDTDSQVNTFSERARAVLTFDARTETEYGTLRSFIEIEATANDLNSEGTPKMVMNQLQGQPQVRFEQAADSQQAQAGQPRGQTGTMGARTAQQQTAPQEQTGVVSGTSPPETADLMARGDRLLAQGDLLSARLLYQRAAEAGDARAAMAVGLTYDPVEFERLGVRGGLRPDPTRAMELYRQASAAGIAEADQRISALAAWSSRQSSIPPGRLAPPTTALSVKGDKLSALGSH